jgi:hypothetical protein
VVTPNDGKDGVDVCASAVGSGFDGSTKIKRREVWWGRDEEEYFEATMALETLKPLEEVERTAKEPL